MMEALAELDRFLFLLINIGCKNPVFDWVMPLISEWKQFWLPVGLILAFFLWRGGARTRWILLALIMVFALSDSINTYVLKPFFARPRPFITLSDIFVYKGGNWGPSEMIEAHRTMSFPSTHAVNVTGAATLLIYFFRRWWPLPAVSVVLVCFSRVYLGVHYPADVLAGVPAGICCAGLILAVQAWLVRLFPGRFQWLTEEART
ncbi:MAG: phosphatase PAP2 family protein [Thermodesulfobacteriota bacterium]|nr:phosphatase PAP2 family protein [Thermodesulfobacteriota bacterium]